MKKQYLILIASFFTITGLFAQVDTSNAHWMSGNWGLGTIIGTGNNNYFDVDGFINQVAQIEGPSHILLNLTKNANGDRYTSPHPVLELMGPNAVPPAAGRDILMEIAQKLDSLGLRLMVYVATEGPAKLKGANSYTKAHDYNPNTMTSSFVDNWTSFVLDSLYVNEPGSDQDKLKRAFAEVVIAEYAERFGDLIDLWWFDHAVFGNIPLLDSVINAHNPGGAVAFNIGQKVPLTNNSPGFEDCSFGHVTPVSHFPPTDSVNLPMITSIENSTNGTGYFGSPPSLGHIALPAQSRWFIGDYLWDEVQATNYMSRVMCAKGSITWTVKQQAGTGFIDTTLVSFLQKVAADCSSIPSGSLTSDPISTTLIGTDTLLADSSYTRYQWYANDVLVAGETNQVLSNLVVGQSYSVRATHASGCRSKSVAYEHIMDDDDEQDMDDDDDEQDMDDDDDDEQDMDDDDDEQDMDDDNDDQDMDDEDDEQDMDDDDEQDMDDDDDDQDMDDEDDEQDMDDDEQTATSIKDVDEEQILLYPNPISDNKVYYKGLIFEHLQIFSINGKLLDSQLFTSKKEIDLSKLEAGMYFISFIRDNRTIVTQKVVKM